MVRERGSGVTPDRVVELLEKEVSDKSILAVSRATGIGLAAIGRYLKGIGEPTTATLEKLAKYFGKSVWELRGDSVFDNWGAHLSFTDKLLLTANFYFEQVLEDDYAAIQESFFLDVVLSLARVVIEMPVEIYKSKTQGIVPLVLQEDVILVKTNAEKVIDKYSDYVSRTLRS